MNDVTVPIGMKIHGISGKEYRGGAVAPVADLRESQVVKLSAKFDKQEKDRKAQEKAEAKASDESGDK